jgi:hypothetical protein
MLQLDPKKILAQREDFIRLGTAGSMNAFTQRKFS